MRSLAWVQFCFLRGYLNLYWCMQSMQHISQAIMSANINRKQLLWSTWNYFVWLSLIHNYVSIYWAINRHIYLMFSLFIHFSLSIKGYLNIFAFINILHLPETLGLFCYNSSFKWLSFGVSVLSSLIDILKMTSISN